MTLPTKESATALLHQHVSDEYQRLHAQMVATAMEGYAGDLFLRPPEGHPAQAPSASLQAAPEGATISALPRSVGEDPLLWYVTGLLHDIDYEQHPETHPRPSLAWFKDWGYPGELIHAVEAHAYGYHDFKTLPQTKLAAALLACDEISGIFYAYRKMNPVPYGQMKASSIRKKLKDHGFAAKVDRSTILLGCEKLGVSLDDHIANLIRHFAALP